MSRTKKMSAQWILTHQNFNILRALDVLLLVASILHKNLVRNVRITAIESETLSISLTHILYAWKMHESVIQIWIRFCDSKDFDLVCSSFGPTLSHFPLFNRCIYISFCNAIEFESDFHFICSILRAKLEKKCLTIHDYASVRHQFLIFNLDLELMWATHIHSVLDIVT